MRRFAETGRIIFTIRIDERGDKSATFDDRLGTEKTVPK